MFADMLTIKPVICRFTPLVSPATPPMLTGCVLWATEKLIETFAEMLAEKLFARPKIPPNVFSWYV